MQLYVHDFLGNESGIIPVSEALPTLETLANTYRYSLDSTDPRNLKLASTVLHTILELRDPFETTKALLLATKPETNGCIEAMIWRPVIEDFWAERFDVRRNQELSYELKTMVFPALVRNKGDHAGLNSNGSLVLLAFHTTADKNLMDAKKIEMEINRIFADQLGRRGKKICLIGEADFQVHFNDTVTGILGIEKGEINPLSLIEVAKLKCIPLVTLIDSDISKRTSPISTNFCRRTLSVRYSSGKELTGILIARGACEDIAKLNVIDGVALSNVIVVPASKFFNRPRVLSRLDNGWVWDPAAHQNKLAA